MTVVVRDTLVFFTPIFRPPVVAYYLASSLFTGVCTPDPPRGESIIRTGLGGSSALRVPNTKLAAVGGIALDSLFLFLLLKYDDGSW